MVQVVNRLQALLDACNAVIVAATTPIGDEHYALLNEFNQQMFLNCEDRIPGLMPSHLQKVMDASSAIYVAMWNPYVTMFLIAQLCGNVSDSSVGEWLRVRMLVEGFLNRTTAGVDWAIADMNPPVFIVMARDPMRFMQLSPDVQDGAFENSTWFPKDLRDQMREVFEEIRGC